MLFPWKKNRIEKLLRSNRNNEALIEVLKIEGIKEKNILGAIKKVPREIFIERQFIQQAYENIPLPIDCGQTISQPFVVAYMTQHSDPQPNDSVLEVGGGCGYQAAILGEIAKTVCSLEIVESVNLPSESPFPEKENRNTAIPDAANLSANAMTKGRSLLPVTPCPRTTMFLEFPFPS